MRSSSAATVLAVSRTLRARMMATPVDYFFDLTIFQIEYAKSSNQIANRIASFQIIRIAKMV